MSILVQNPMESLGRGLQTAGSALGGAFQKFGEERQQKGILEQVLGDLDFDDPESMKKVISNPQFAQLPDPMQKLIGNQFTEAKKNQAFKMASKEASEKGGLFSEEGQNTFIKSYADRGGDPLEVLKYLPKMEKEQSKSQTTYQRELDKVKAKVVGEYIQGGDQRDKRLNSTMQYLEREVENVGLANSLLSGDYVMPGERYTQYENMGNLMLDQVIKIFNPAGVLPQTKLKWIKDQFSISPYDRQEVIKGKINAIKSLLKEGNKNYSKIGELINEYGDEIPTKEFMQAMSGLENTLDDYITDSGKPPSQKSVNRLPTKAKKGSVATDTKSGKKYVFDGKRWKLRKS